MMTFARVDERLFHGQVAVKWVGQVKATDVVIIDDETAASPALIKMFVGLAPKGVTMTVLTLEESPERLKSPEFTAPEKRVFIIAKTPAPFLFLLESGVSLPVLNVGNMFIKPGRKMFLRSFYATDEEVEQFKKILEYGVECYCQEIPNGGLGYGRKDLKKVLKIK